MRVDEDKIVAWLVKKTRQSPKEVRAQLDEFKNRLRLVIETEEPFFIDDFGTFSNKEGVLQFEPDQQLQAEINQQYAGMQAVELAEGYRETGAGIPVEEERPKETVGAVPKAADEKKPVKAQTASNKTKKPPKEQEKQDRKPVLNAEGKAAAPAAKKGKARKEKPAFGRGRNRNGAMGRAVLAAVVVILILGTGWFLYDHGALRNLKPGRQSTVTDSSASHVPGGLAITKNEDPARDRTEQKSSATVSNKQRGDTPEASPKYGLKGSFNDQLKGAYTIVVHSFHLKSTVQKISDRLQGAGYRTVLFQNAGEARSWWRLGLGQFKTAKSAQDSAQTLRAPFKEHHFIRKIPDNF